MSPQDKSEFEALSISALHYYGMRMTRNTTNGHPFHLRLVTRFYVYTGIHYLSFCLSQLRFSRWFFYIHRHISSSVLPEIRFSLQFLLSLVTATFPLYPLIGSCSFFFSLPAPLSSKTLRAVRKLKNYKEREFPDFRQTSAEK